MGWSSGSVVEERRRFIEAWLSRRFTIVELAELFGVSERVAHKTLARFKAEGFEGLADRSRARHRQVRTADEVVGHLVDVRRRFPTWGPRKLLGVVRATHPHLDLPAPSTVTEILRRSGLLGRATARRRRPVYPTGPCVEAHAPNDAWSMDYKGQFRTGDGVYCYPFTVTDNASRMILLCKALRGPHFEATWDALVGCFREYGLPVALRSDNGSPFAGAGVTRLSQLSVRLIRLGIVPDYIAPGKPQQNGRHERMHRTLKAETASPPAANLKAQQRRFKEFVDVFNGLRPHDALGGKTPNAVHVRSPRPMPAELPTISYDSGCITRAVRQNGTFKWDAHEIYLSTPLGGERVLFNPVDDGLYVVKYGPVDVAVFDEKTMRLRAAGRKPLKRDKI